jgi:ubiquitin C-terminal hydrolase
MCPYYASIIFFLKSLKIERERGALGPAYSLDYNFDLYEKFIGLDKSIRNIFISCVQSHMKTCLGCEHTSAGVDPFRTLLMTLGNTRVPLLQDLLSDVTLAVKASLFEESVTTICQSVPTGPPQYSSKVSKVNEVH